MAIDAIRAAYDALGTGDVEPLVSLMDEGNGVARASSRLALLASASLLTRAGRGP